MRHLKKGRKLNRTSSHRKALFSNLASSLVINKRIITTHPKAKELQNSILFSYSFRFGISFSRCNMGVEYCSVSIISYLSTCFGFPNQSRGGEDESGLLKGI